MNKLNYHAVKNGKYRYELDESIEVGAEIFPEYTASISYKSKCIVVLTHHGFLFIDTPYQWDGPSGPVRHSPDIMRGSLIHDALYQLMRENKIGKKHRKAADIELYHTCLEDGMYPFKATCVYYAVRLFGWLFV